MKPGALDATLSIGEVARVAGIRPSAIRYYESVGLLPAPARRSGHRRYDPSTPKPIAIPRFAQRAGFTVAEIRTLFHGFGADVPPARRWQSLAKRKQQELDDIIANAQRMRRAVEVGMQCGCLRTEDCATDLDAGCCLPGPQLTAIVSRRKR